MFEPEEVRFFPSVILSACNFFWSVSSHHIFVSGNRKLRALRLDAGNFAWPSETMAKKARILDVVYNASNAEMVRTKTLVKNAIVTIDAIPYRNWFDIAAFLFVSSTGNGP